MKSRIRLGVLLCILITASIHLYLAVTADLPMFYANALGYIALGAAYANIGIPISRERATLLLKVYTMLTIGLWLVFGAHTMIAYSAKVVEVVLVGLLLIEQRID